MLLGALTLSSTSQVRCENYGIPGPWMLFCDLWICRRKICTVAYNVWRRTFCSKRMIHKIMCSTAFWIEQKSRWPIFLHRGKVYLLKKKRTVPDSMSGKADWCKNDQKMALQATHESGRVPCPHIDSSFIPKQKLSRIKSMCWTAFWVG
jgi:hypothetical protein